MKNRNLLRIGVVEWNVYYVGIGKPKAYRIRIYFVAHCFTAESYSVDLMLSGFVGVCSVVHAGVRAALCVLAAEAALRDQPDEFDRCRGHRAVLRDIDRERVP